MPGGSEEVTGGSVSNGARSRIQLSRRDWPREYSTTSPTRSGWQVIKAGKDYGPLTKVIPSLLDEVLIVNTDLIVTIDDDIRYYPSFIEDVCEYTKNLLNEP